ncbi:hypothetical protein KOEU_10680 [Komagataeibacter europaeus]|uniref:Lipoprotein n=1 Tax=Komagataeibacter europaeus TaxID=33995 RepID=A0A0M0EIZ8_KOMEU|nr:hypothetical protein [Komagataeibacter europaeus]KON65228.1 hypothetical protein KOEU_10680 [Komagataeibacter europaeus]
MKPTMILLAALALVASLTACADRDPRMDRNARAAYDNGNGGPQGGWGSLGGGWGGPGDMGW